jgi:hypothetical protein
MPSQPAAANPTRTASERLSLGALMTVMVVTHVWFFTQALSYMS